MRALIGLLDLALFPTFVFVSLSAHEIESSDCLALQDSGLLLWALTAARRKPSSSPPAICFQLAAEPMPGPAPFTASAATLL
jgi:hypothetical protein